jgi:GAF domain-containing protein
LARHEALFRVSRAINVYRDPSELFRALGTELRQVVDFDFVGLFLYDEAANKVRNAARALRRYAREMMTFLTVVQFAIFSKEAWVGRTRQEKRSSNNSSRLTFLLT